MVNVKMKIYLVETREESNHITGERRGLWYQCGYEIHHTKRSAMKEIKEFKMGHDAPYRVVEYVRKK